MVIINENRTLFRVDVKDSPDYFGAWTADPLEAYGLYLDGVLGDLLGEKSDLFSYKLSESEFNDWTASGYAFMPNTIEESRVKHLGSIEDVIGNYI